MNPCPCCGCEITTQDDGTPKHIGRQWYENDDNFCYRRQVKALRKKVESLIDAGDALADCVRHDSPGYVNDHVDRWDEAKDS